MSPDRNPASKPPGGDAWHEALRRIAARPSTRAEIRTRLSTLGHAEQTVDRVLSRLEQRGYLDDAELAWNFIVSRAPRMGHGPRRLIGDLERRGVSPETARAAWRRAVEHGDLDEVELLRRELRRRLGRSPQGLDRRTMRRVYQALLRAGFEAAAVHRELTALGSPQGFDDELA